jgi:hypothetical protein
MRTRFWLLMILPLLAVAVRLYRLPAQSIWFDEGWSAYAAVQPTLQSAIDADPTNPPLYYLLLNLAVRGFGDSEFALRYVSLLLGVLAVPLSYQLACRLFSSSAGMGAAFLVAFSPLMWWASQEARMYTMLAVLVLVAALAWQQLIRQPTRRAWLALWLSELSLLYAHNTGPVIVLWLNLITLLAWGFQLVYQYSQRRDFSPPLYTRRPKGGGWGEGLRDKPHLLNRCFANISSPLLERVKSFRPGILMWFAGQIGVGILWSPWFITHFLRLPEANSALHSAPQINLDFFGQLWAALWTGSWAMVIRPEADVTPYIPIILTLTLIISVLLIPWRKPAAYWLLAHVVILTGALILGLAVLGNEMHGRYLVMVAPLLLTLIGSGLTLAGAKLFSSILSLFRPLAAVIFLSIFFVAVHLVSQNPAYQHDDARGMVRYYAEHLTAADTVLAWSYADRYELAYYWDRLGVVARRVTLPEGADLDEILPLLPSSGDVALNVWYTQRADYRGMMGCLLGNGTVNEPEQVSFYGMTNELYRAPSLSLPELRPFNAAIADMANLNAVGTIATTTADKALCLPLQIQLMGQTDADLKAALIVHNALGWEIARDDTPFADAAQRTTSVLATGDIMTAYPLLRLPYGAPPGDYQISLRIYDEIAQPSGYDLHEQGSNRPLRDLPLGTWTVNLGSDWSQVNRASSLLVERNISVSDNLMLLADNIQGGTFHNGDEIRLSLLWEGNGELPGLTLADTVNVWQIDIPSPSYPDRDAILLDWRTITIPLDAPSGQAELRLPDGSLLATYTIESLPAIYDQPSFDTPIGAEFSGVGTLVGYTLESDTLDRSLPFDIILIWRADETAVTSYTVFVQLIDADGQVIAQADAVPAANTRPTNNWRTGEYIVDIQHLTFNEAAQPGTARLLVGLYEPATGERVPLTSGGDFVVLAEAIEIR